MTCTAEVLEKSSFTDYTLTFCMEDKCKPKYFNGLYTEKYISYFISKNKSI